AGLPGKLHLGKVVGTDLPAFCRYCVRSSIVRVFAKSQLKKIRPCPALSGLSAFGFVRLVRLWLCPACPPLALSGLSAFGFVRLVRLWLCQALSAFSFVRLQSALQCQIGLTGQPRGPCPRSACRIRTSRAPSTMRRGGRARDWSSSPARIL